MSRFRPTPTPVLLVLSMLVAVGRALVPSFELQARLDEPGHTVEGSARVVMYNDSAAPITGFWLQLHPNAFRSRDNDFARNLRRMERFDLDWLTRLEAGGIEIGRATWEGKPLSLRSDSFDTAVWLSLPRPLAPRDTGVLELRFSTRIPGFFASWLGRADRFFILANWYPKPAATRDGQPWPGDYVVRLEVPADLAVGSSGRMTGSPGETDWMTWPPSHRPVRDASKVLEFTDRDVTDFAWVAGADLVLLRDSVRDIELNLLVRDAHRDRWRDVPGQVAKIVRRYATWYGPPGPGSLTIVAANGIVPEDWTGPGLSVVAEAGLPATRMRERALARQLAYHWFGNTVHPDRVGFSWLNDGAAVYSEMRYLDERHGVDNLLTIPTLGLLHGLSAEYYNRATYYLAASNGLVVPLSYPYMSERLSIADAQPSQAGRFLLMLERTIGREAFDAAVQGYLATSRAGGPDPAAFAAACSDAYGEDLGWFFERWLSNWQDPGSGDVLPGGSCDYRLARVTRSGSDVLAHLELVGDIPMPVDVEFVFTDGTTERRTWRLPARNGVVQLATPKRVRRVTLDPDEKLLEVDRWNNHWPRRVDIKPLFALPSFDAYQLFYGPYAWYDEYNGFQLAAWLQGRQFIDLGPLRGRHMWTLTETYSTGLGVWTTNAWYQTPLSLISNRIRLNCLAKYSRLQTRFEAKLVGGLSPMFRQTGATAELGYEYLELTDLQGRDARAWDSARTAEVRISFLHDYRAGRFRGSLRALGAVGRTELGGSDDYVRMAIETAHSLRLARGRGLRVRAFAGAIPGSIPNQNQFYLSGGLIPTPAEPVTWAYEGAASGQEHWHFDGDVNCRGYAGEYIHGRFAYGLNVEFFPLPFIQPFFDIGNVGDSVDAGFWRARMDAGIKLKLGPLYAAFPVWRYRLGGRHEFAPNWMLGLNLTGLTDF